MKKFLYHASCHDGFCAAWIAHHIWPDAEFIPVQYGDDPPVVTQADVIIADFSYSRDILLQMKQEAKSLLVFDHHKTAQRALAGLDFCTFDMAKSGARIFYNYCRSMGLIKLSDNFLTSDPIQQWLIDYTEDRDLWYKRLPATNEINAAIRSRPFTFAAWDELAQTDLTNLIQEGTGILRYQKQIIDNHLKHTQMVEINGIKGKGCSCTVANLYSDLAEAILEDSTVPFAAIWCDTIKGTRIYSLRSRTGLDVSELAELYPGGGGHKAAAGFQIQCAIMPVAHMPIHSTVPVPAAHTA